MNSSKSIDLLQNILNGDSTAFQKIYTSTFPTVKIFVKKNKGSEDDAHEIFQDALFQIIVRAKVKKLELRSSFEAYLFTVCKNLWYRELNKMKKEVRNNKINDLNIEDRELESILYQERWDLFEEKISCLSEKCINLLKDYFNKVSYKFIVEKYSFASENAAFQRVFKCKKQLTKLIKEDFRYQELKQK